MEPLKNDCLDHNLPYTYLAYAFDEENPILICTNCLKHNDYLSIQSLSDLRARYHSAFKRYTLSLPDSCLEVLNKLNTKHMEMLV